MEEEDGKYPSRKFYLGQCDDNGRLEGIGRKVLIHCGGTVEVLEG